MKITKISMIGDITLYKNGKERKIEVSESSSSIKSLDELEELENPSALFMELDSASKESGKIFLSYTIPEEYESLDESSLESKVVKLEIIKNFLNKEPLSACKGMTYLDPANIYIKNYSSFKIMYRSNSEGQLPYDQQSHLDQYKFFILGFLSDKFNYKKYSIHKSDLLLKEDNQFMFSVFHSQSIGELKKIVDDELKAEQFRCYEEVNKSSINQKKKFKNKFIIIGVSALVLLFGIVLVVKVTENKVVNQYASKEEDLKSQQELSLALASKDTNKAITALRKQNKSSLDIAEMLVDIGDYNKAITMDKKVEEKVIEKLYKLNQKEEILKLKSKSTFVENEKAIVKFDVENLSNLIALINSKHTMIRLGLAFLDHEEFELAIDVFNRLSDGEAASTLGVTKTERKDAGLWSKIAGIQIEISNLNDKIIEEKSKVNNEKEKLKDNVKLSDLETQVMKSQKEIIQLESQLSDVR
ncbi:hypothetical protein [Bacillus stratosphericus]|uniref:hypothetical protein n=1 Tax=Bacillus stratosphericus TaxID=293386 RepID=UPI001CF99AF2|nr:hypothetical protein [Bacillus stratosphericus]